MDLPQSHHKVVYVFYSFFNLYSSSVSSWTHTLFFYQTTYYYVAKKESAIEDIIDIPHSYFPTHHPSCAVQSFCMTNNPGMTYMKTVVIILFQ